MNILITNTSDKPIYEQIFIQLRDQILGGALQPGGAFALHPVPGQGSAGERHHHQTGL